MAENIEDIEIELLLEAMYQHYHYDFRNYARASLKRRLLHARKQLGYDSISAMQSDVLHDRTMLPRLLNYLTVQVSEMFRDPSYFRALREKVIPHLRTYASLKVWVAGCSNGEELYSLSILFREEGLAHKTMFYATDINPNALKAAEGRLSARTDPAVHREPPEGGRPDLAVRLLHRRLWPRGVRQVAAQSGRLF